MKPIISPFGQWLLAVLIAVLWHGATASHACAADHANGFDEAATSWKTQFDATSVRVHQHRRHPQVFINPPASEYVMAEAGVAGGVLVLEQSIPATRVLDDFKLTLWVRSNRTGITPALRLVLPNDRDPQTGDPLTIQIPAPGYSTIGKWQQLECTALEKQVRERIVLLRARLNEPNITGREIYIDRVVLTMELQPGVSELFIDELRCGPMVSPRADVTQASADDGVQPAGPPVEFRLDRLLVQGKPFFPRLTAWHQEPFSAVRAAGMNVVWVPDHSDEETMSLLRKEGLWAAATPPRETDDDGRTLDPHDANMVPFSESAAQILFWNIGTRIPADAKEDVFRWVEQVRNADRNANRPVMIDVTGLERVYSRKVPMLGVSRHVVQTSMTIKQYRDWLNQRRKVARPGSFLWTWIQTEPVPAQADWRTAAGHHPAIVEPEQIRLQVYAALAAGTRGLGFWKTGAIDGDGPGALERRLILAQLNLELELLEPWLATGTIGATIPFEVNAPALPRIGQRLLDFRNSDPEKQERDALLRARDDELRRANQIKSELEATLIRTEYGLLVLPVWYDTDAQYSPGQMAANDAGIVIPGADESASIWEVTTTGIRSLARERVAGGTKVTLSKFDQTAAVIVTADRGLIKQLREKAERLAPRSAEIMLALAKAKFERVRLIDEELHGLGLSQPDGPQLLGRANTLISEAETAQSRQDFVGTRQKAEDSLQLLRILQRSHWNDAIRTVSTPVSSPHTVCFQTLPDHYRMLASLGRSSLNDVNLLRSGDFEDIDTMVVEGWKPTQRTIEGIRTAAELYPVSQQGKYSLRMIAVPDRQSKDVEAPAVVPEAPVLVSTPQVTVRAGQIIHISGWVKVVTPVTGSLDGVMFYDNLLGTAGAIRWNTSGNWSRFEVIREVQESGPLVVTMALTGMGEVLFDDLRIVPHAPRSEGASPPGLSAAEAGGPRSSGTMSFLKNLPRLPRISSRRPNYTPQDPPSAPDPIRNGAAPNESRQRQ